MLDLRTARLSLRMVRYKEEEGSGKADLLVPLVALLVALTALTLDLLLAPPKWLFELLQLVSLPSSFVGILFGIAIVNIAVSLAFETYLSWPISSFIGRWLKRWRARRGHGGSRKLYKAIEAEMMAR